MGWGHEELFRIKLKSSILIRNHAKHLRRQLPRQSHRREIIINLINYHIRPVKRVCEARGHN